MVSYESDMVCTALYTGVSSMEPITTGIREFRENLAEYLLQSNSPVAITRHGDTIAPPVASARRRNVRRSRRLADMLAAKGVTEDELVADFKKWRAAKRKGLRGEDSRSMRTY
jgi:antitoxin (DNA-binding transcriptional repressor) of toxin-antitoxin stability system